MVESLLGTGVKQSAVEVVFEELLRVLHIQVLSVSGNTLLAIVGGNGEGPYMLQPELLGRQWSWQAGHAEEQEVEAQAEMHDGVSRGVLSAAAFGVGVQQGCGG